MEEEEQLRLAEVVFHQPQPIQVVRRLIIIVAGEGMLKMLQIQQAIRTDPIAMERIIVHPTMRQKQIQGLLPAPCLTPTMEALPVVVVLIIQEVAPREEAEAVVAEVVAADLHPDHDHRAEIINNS